MDNVIQASSLGIDFEKGICAICRKRPVEYWCDYITEYRNGPLFVRDFEVFAAINKRGAQYQTCDLPMCKECAKEVSYDTHLCTHHYELHKQADLPDEYQKMRQTRERSKIMKESLKPTDEEKLKNKGQMSLFE